MLCLTGCEPELDAVLRRIRSFPDDLHEVRLDCLAHVGENLSPLRPFASKVLCTLRSEQHGGLFKGSRTEYEERLHRVFDQHPGLVDVEYGKAPYLARLLDRGRDRVVLSWHGKLPGPQELAALASEMASQGSMMRKVAIEIGDAAELAALLDLAHVLPPPFVVVGMGGPGRASRFLYQRFGSAWTFVTAGAAVPGAASQLTLSDAWALAGGQFGSPDGADGFGGPTPLGIIGASQVLHSPGLRVYNRVFRDRALPLVYVALPTAHFPETLALAQRLGFRGLSVTMPFKGNALSLCRRVDELARMAGAVNTLVWEDGGWAGYNTDVVAVRLAVQSSLAGPLGAVAVLGAGGAARAAVVALADLAPHIHVFCRDPASNATLAAQSPRVVLRPWQSFDPAGFAVLVNATPLGSDGITCPVDSSASLADKLVLDMVHTPIATPLIKLAKASGGVAITGRSLWILQGVAQMQRMLGDLVTQESLEEAWP